MTTEIDSGMAEIDTLRAIRDNAISLVDYTDPDRPDHAETVRQTARAILGQTHEEMTLAAPMRTEVARTWDIGDPETLASEVESLRAAVARVRARHSEINVDGRPVCAECVYWAAEPVSYPCPTIRTLEAALAARDLGD